MGVRTAGPILALCLGLLSPGGVAWAQSAVTFDFDDPPETRNKITDSLSWGAALELELLSQDNLDLDGASDDRQTSLEPIADLAFTFEPSAQFRVFLDLELSRLFLLDQPGGAGSENSKLEVKEAYVTLREVAPGLSLQAGRQLFQDELEWIYDQELDGARAFYRLDSLALEASVTREGLAPVDLFNDDQDIGKAINGFLVGHQALSEETSVSPYLLVRDGRGTESEDLVFLGLQSLGELSDNLDYWVNAAYLTGQGSDSSGAPSLSGVGLDLVASYASGLAWDPSGTLGLAFGSGDPGADGDRGFRQTGLQANNAEFNGVTRFKYYGEVLDPELSNLLVLSAGAGLRPSESSSVDLVYHYYHQHQARGSLRNSALEAEPDGRNASLGHGLDLIIGFHDEGAVSAELVAGAFLPGAAFGSDADPAYLLGFELQFEF